MSITTPPLSSAEAVKDRRTQMKSSKNADNPLVIELIEKLHLLTSLKMAALEWASNNEPGDTLILYYSGHGYSMENDTYLIPSDVETRYIEETAYNFTTGLKTISEYISAKYL